MKLIKTATICTLGGLFWLLSGLRRLTHLDAFAALWRYAKWKVRLKCLGPDVIFCPGVVIHDAKDVSIKASTCIAEYVHMWGKGGIEIGENVLIGAHAAITSQTHDTRASLYNRSSVSKKVHVEDNAWIGTHAVIMPGIRIGQNAIIGAGAVVTRDVPPNDIVVGVPARSIRGTSRASRSGSGTNLVTVKE